jgi:hypothetical protein
MTTQQDTVATKNNPQRPPSPVNATYVEPSAERILKPGTKIGDLLRRNMTQPYVLQRLAERAWWVQAFNYGTSFTSVSVVC